MKNQAIRWECHECGKSGAATPDAFGKLTCSHPFACAKPIRKKNVESGRLTPMVTDCDGSVTFGLEVREMIVSRPSDPGMR